MSAKKNIVFSVFLYFDFCICIRYAAPIPGVIAASPAEALLPAECTKSIPQNNIQCTAEMNWQSHVGKSHLTSCEIQGTVDWLIAEKCCKC